MSAERESLSLTSSLSGRSSSSHLHPRRPEQLGSAPSLASAPPPPPPTSNTLHLITSSNPIFSSSSRYSSPSWFLLHPPPPQLCSPPLLCRIFASCFFPVTSFISPRPTLLRHQEELRELREQPIDPQAEQEIIDGIEEIYFSGDSFDMVQHELEVR